MNQYVILYCCETKHKIVSTLHGKKEAASVVMGLQHRMVGRKKGSVQAWWDCLWRRTSCRCWCHKKESTLGSCTSHPWTRDLRTEMNKNPKDNGKCWSFWKCCAFETIITLESAFLKLYLRFMWRKKRNIIILFSFGLNELLSFAVFTFFRNSGIVSQVA